MPNILHLVENLENTSSFQSIISTARWSAQLKGHNHSITVLNTADPEAISQTNEAGIRLLIAPDSETLLQEIADADIVQIAYLNTPTINTLLRRELPHSRLAMWCHISGESVPHIIPQAAGRMVDVCIAGSEKSYSEHPVFVNKLAFEPEEKIRLIRPSIELSNIERQAHAGFNVGYTGSHNLTDLHPEYIPMSAAIELADVQFIICGDDVDGRLASQARALQGSDRFEFKKNEDITEILEILDVFGYAVHEQASPATLQLQSAMFAGIAPVVLNHSAIQGLIKHNETGLIVHSAEDYKRAIEFLYNNPVERKRIGLNASIYARTHFGAQNAAREMNKVYDFLMTQPRQNHVWNYSPYQQELLPQHVETPSAAQIFVDAMDKNLPAFEISLNHTEVDQQIEAEQDIAYISDALFNAIQQQKLHAPNDPYLKVWAGLYLEQHDQMSLAVTEYAAALENGLDSWRVQWYLARALFNTGKENESRRIYAALRQEVSGFDDLTGDLQFTETQHQTIQLSIPGLSEEPVIATAADDTRIRVSAIVSTYASEAFIDGCMHNLVSQSLFQQGELEIIVIDAHSPENEQEIVARYQANFDNIQYVRTPARETLYASWNRGIKLAKGQYITNANTDDRHKKNALETLANYLDAHPEFALLYPGQIDTSVPNESFETTSSSKLLNWPPYTYAELERHCIIGSQPVWRKSLHEKYGYFRAEMKSAADYEFWLRIGKHENLYRYPETLGLYYRNPEGIEHGSQTSEMETLQIWQEYGMFDRGIQVILRGRLVTKASTPNFTPPVSTLPQQLPQQLPEQKLTFDIYITNFEAAIQKQNYEEALSIAASAEQYYSELPYPMILKAIAYRQRDEYALALESLEKSIRIDETPEALIELIQLSSTTGQQEEAKRTAKYMQVKYPEWEERLNQLNTALLQDETTPPAGPAKLEDLNFSLSTFSEIKEEFAKLLHFKEISKAETLALAATLKFPDNHEAWVLKATSNRLKGSLIEARDAIHKSLLIEDSPEALIELFQVSQALGDEEEAKNIAGMFDHTYPEYSMRFNDLFPGVIQ